MPLTLPSAIIGLKNKLASTEAFILLLEVDIDNIDVPTTLRFARNTENVTWSGQTFVAFQFEIDVLGDSDRGEVPQVNLQVSNVSRAVQSYVEQADGGVDAPVRIYLVHETQFSTSEYAIRLDYIVNTTSCNQTWVNFELSASNPWNRRVPATRCRKNFCRWVFKGQSCTYAGAGTSCDKTLSQCKSFSNSLNFGGYPGLGYKSGVRI